MVSEKLPEKDSALFTKLQMEFALKQLDPENSQSLAEIANEFNKRYLKRGVIITIRTLLRWKRDPIYIARKNAMVARLEEQYSGDIDKKLIEMCLRGSHFHMNIWYTKRGKLVHKHQEVKDDLPRTKEEVDKEISKLIAMTTPLEEE